MSSNAHYKYLNFWNRNFWNRPRFFPYKIPDGAYFEYDWFPAKKPYDI